MAKNFRQRSSMNTDDNPHLIGLKNKTPPISKLYYKLCRRICCYTVLLLVAVPLSCFLYRVIVLNIVHASQFDINSFSMSTFAVNTSQKITANWTINFSIDVNPMNKSLSYEKIDVLLSYNDVLVKRMEPAPIQQGIGNNASLEVKTATSPAVLDGRVAEAVRHKHVNDTMVFDIEVNSRVRAGEWEKFNMRINCPQIKVEFYSNDKAEMLPDDSARPYCHHKLYRIIWF